MWISFFNTLSERRSTTDIKPMTASPTLESPILLKTPTQVEMKASPSMFKPSKDFTCVVAIVKADAEVNPAITGEAMKSRRVPGTGRIK